MALAEEAPLDRLFDRLADPELANWQQVENEIWGIWSKSGSDTADLLLERGRQAMTAGDMPAAIDHLSALIDHAPDFAEGYNARATAYFQAGLLGLSLRDIEATLALNPRHFGALSGLGMILEQIGDEARALDAYRMVNAIHPHRPNVKDAMKRLEARLGETAL
ncbi:MULTISPECIES: tetratricopeptide repeat protein [unclassified Meridianimarinicoccus]|uniref:tetratricopeptide repeat protein n=1 Tax=unclassified Meridianimarinicoccus TaxID=2923344 RepID=UPI00186703F5|nr:tetratricopeptide repeat protein [Fluviibacterium sp. MJW13]